ncbi:phage tail tape measure protein [Cedecea neteri]|uniref:Phage tail tape measure protein n=1 Tax=Cedecea neteri TaxID=158822 RepID=A0A291DYX1_9ENTR|nr:phage tail tape measure protein [Cedecea neteri]ATF92415.1 phage tail tape measure protein [Cedecea neteri]ATF92836.1 phage tail tape measure protein [Cedecea neteri]
MAGPFETQMSIGLRDNASAGIQRIRNEVKRMQEAREVLGIRSERTIQQKIDQTSAAYLRLARSGTLSATEQQRAWERTSSIISRLNKEMSVVEQQQQRLSRNPAREARAVLGIRSEQDIRREIAQTEAAYNRLERSGVMSAMEQQRAYAQMTSTVGKLRRELGETERTQSRLASGLKTGLKVAGTVGAVAVGTGLALRKPIEDRAVYDQELRNQANFTYSGLGLEGRKKGMGVIDQQIRSATDYSGASITEALTALETMQRSGVMKPGQPGKFLPNVLKNAVATGADAASVANTQASAVNFGLNDKDAIAAVSLLTTDAQHGRMSVPVLAETIPRGLEAGKSAGFFGRRGFAQIAGLFEASSIGAQNSEDAAVNVNDLLAEMTSSNLKNNAKRIKINGRGIDIQKMTRHDLALGLTPLDTITNVIGKMDENDPQYRRVKKQLAHTTDPDKRELLEAQLQRYHGEHISALFHNQQSRNAYINFDRNREFYNRLVNEGVAQFDLTENKRSASQDFNLIKQGPEWQFNHAKNAAIFASYDATNEPTTLAGKLADEFADLAKRFPTLAESVSITTTAFHSLYDAVGGWAVWESAVLRCTKWGKNSSVKEKNQELVLSNHRRQVPQVMRSLRR